MSERSNRQESTNVWFFALQVGLFAGIIWGGVKQVEYYFKFTSVSPGFLAAPFFKASFLRTTAGFWTGWAYFIVFSILAAFLYAAMLRKVRGPWMGIGYGIIWWALLYLMIGPATGMMKWINELNWNTILSDFFLFVVWGLFIGFSISFEFTDEREREPSGPQAGHMMK